MTTVSTKLLHVLLGKAIAETILVGTLALAFFFQAFPPCFRGWGEADQKTIAGWATDIAHPGARVMVQLFIDGRFVSQQEANQYRPDVSAAGWAADDWHGYRFVVEGMSTGEHRARVYALHASGDAKRQSLQMLGNPIDFVVESDGSFRELKTDR